MNMMDTIYEKAAANRQRVAFPEAEEEKILLAAREAEDKQLCRAVLVGSKAEIEAAAAQYGVAISGMELFDASDAEALEKLCEEYAATNPMFSVKSLLRKCRDPLYTALILEALGRVDATFAGLAHTTGDVILAGQMIVGLQEGVTTVSSIGIANIPGWAGAEGQLLAFGDSAVCVDPNEEDLAGIAIAACDTVKRLLGWEPRCALLSYSTTGSAESPFVDKVRNAVSIANVKRPDLKIDGEFQLDAALKPEVAAKKLTRPSEVAGKANIIIWPDIDVGNIGVKLMQTLGGADAYGPILQGFRKIVCDCSRGAPVSELVGNIAISCVNAQGDRNAGATGAEPPAAGATGGNATGTGASPGAIAEVADA
jgi:phosphate acetyltransferase